jgi:hypothetical protein
MAGRVLAAPDVPGGRLVVADDLHTRLEPLPVDDPIGAHIGVPIGAELVRRAPDCARSTVSTAPASSTTSAHVAAMSTAYAGSSWMALG